MLRGVGDASHLLANGTLPCASSYIWICKQRVRDSIPIAPTSNLGDDLLRTSDLDVIHKLLFRHNIQDDLVVIRLSSRAKRLLLKYSIPKGVEIIIPNGADPSWVAEMTQSRIPWIRSAQQHVRDGRSQLNPTQIDLKALDETWSVHFEKVDEVRNGLLVSGERTLTLGVDTKDVLYVARNLQKWFQQKARASLIPWLASLADDRGLRFNRTYVKNQVSLWGSCSKKRNINLNRNLLFIPKHLVEYVLHHELTHLDHLNHSGMFWSSFSRVLPDCRDLRRELSFLKPDDIPLWASPGLDSV
ncbi:M48 family metallopeptidase [SAR202 cluster bacterium AC-647-N09_OGT_505m]|nr:M48 family metallopeptidase [SAR202 cluster bacterium AC-647-N09_OGT_505m]